MTLRARDGSDLLETVVASVPGVALPEPSPAVFASFVGLGLLAARGRRSPADSRRPDRRRAIVRTMRTRTVLPWILAVSFALGCAHRDRHHDHGAPPPQGHTAGHVRGHGPPPHAPAHGYRHKFGGRYLEYDSAYDVYVVIGLPDLFWYDGWYHRRIGDRWQRSDDERGPWYDSAWDDIPPGLRGTQGKGRKGKKKGG